MPPRKPKGRRKFRGRGRPKLGGRQINESVLGAGAVAKAASKQEVSSVTSTKDSGKTGNRISNLKKSVDVAQMNSLRAVYETIGKGTKHLSKSKLIRGIKTSISVQKELSENPDLHHLLKPNRYESKLEAFKTEQDGYITLTELLSFADLLHDKAWEQTMVLQEVFQVILKHNNTPFEDDEHLEVPKKAFIKAVMRDVDVQNLLHKDPVLTVLLKPRKYMATLMRIHPHKEGAISLSEMQHFATELHHEGEEGAQTLAGISSDSTEPLHKVERRSCLRLRTEGGQILHLGCVAYVDPFESGEDNAEDLAIHVEGYELETGKHLNGHGRVDREEYKKDGEALVTRLLKNIKLESISTSQGWHAASLSSDRLILLTPACNIVQIYF